MADRAQASGNFSITTYDVAVYEEAEEGSWCWACNLQGESKVIEIDGRAV